MPVPVRAGITTFLGALLTHPGTIINTMSTTKPQIPKISFSANNSRLTTPSGEQLNLHIDHALAELFESNPELNLRDLSKEFDFMLEQLTKHLPDDFDFAAFKKMNRLLTGTSAFFYLLTTKEKDKD